MGASSEVSRESVRIRTSGNTGNDESMNGGFI